MLIISREGEEENEDKELVGHNEKDLCVRIKLRNATPNLIITA